MINLLKISKYLRQWGCRDPVAHIKALRYVKGWHSHPHSCYLWHGMTPRILPSEEAPCTSPIE